MQARRNLAQIIADAVHAVVITTHPDRDHHRRHHDHLSSSPLSECHRRRHRHRCDHTHPAAYRSFSFLFSLRAKECHGLTSEKTHRRPGPVWCQEGAKPERVPGEMQTSKADPKSSKHRDASSQNGGYSKRARTDGTKRGGEGTVRRGKADGPSKQSKRRNN